jgi:hypothetical protein
MKRSALVLLVALVVAVLPACGSERPPAPKPSPTVDAAAAKAAFAEAYADFRVDFDAAAALREKEGLGNAKRGVRAVRAAYADLADATRTIEMPAEVAEDVEVMLTAIAELVSVLDDQAAARTTEEFRAANPASNDALQQADDAVQVVVDALGVDEPRASESPQRRDTTYIDGGAVTDAEAWVRDLLDVGARHADHRTPAEDMGVVVAWRAAFPEILGESNVVEYERQAPKSGVSGFAVIPTDGRNPASRSNPYYLAFAARDASGACAGGVLSGYPDPTEKRQVEIAPGSRCTGAAVAKAAGY